MRILNIKKYDKATKFDLSDLQLSKCSRSWLFTVELPLLTRLQDYEHNELTANNNNSVICHTEACEILVTKMVQTAINRYKSKNINI